MASLSEHQIKLEYENLAAYGVKFTTIDLVGGILCKICSKTFTNKKEYDSHYFEHNSGNSEIIYTCVRCNRDLTGYRSFRGHCYSVHVIKNRTKCDYCSRFFSKPSVLQQHIQSAHLLKCSFCKKSFKTSKDLKTHQISHEKKSDGPPYDCLFCNQAIDCRDVCERHMDEHCTVHYNCPICSENLNTANIIEHVSQHFETEFQGENFDDIEDLVREEDAVELAGGIQCSVCDNLYRNKSEYDIHFSYHDEQIDYTCNICRKKFLKYPPFQNHCYYHFVKDRFECEQCDQAFPRLSLLVAHASDVHVAAERDHGCGHCARTFTSQRCLLQHVRSAHDGPAMRRCARPGCDALLSTPRQAIAHERKHSGEGVRRCVQCSLPLWSAASCARHAAVHARRRYACPVCARRYPDRRNAARHAPIHFESVLHVCNVCGKIYKARNRLIEHSKTHAKVKGHTCDICGKGFHKPFALHQHMNMHTGTKPFHCTHCDKQFASSANLSKHLHRMHGTGSAKTIKVGAPAQACDSSLQSEGAMRPSVEGAGVDAAWGPPPSQPDYLDLMADLPDSLTVLDPITSAISECAAPGGLRLVEPDDHMLPHMDPRLATRWEPRIFTELRDAPPPTLDMF